MIGIRSRSSRSRSVYKSCLAVSYLFVNISVIILVFFSDLIRFYENLDPDAARMLLFRIRGNSSDVICFTFSRMSMANVLELQSVTCKTSRLFEHAKKSSDRYDDVTYLSTWLLGLRSLCGDESADCLSMELRCKCLTSRDVTCDCRLQLS